MREECQLRRAHWLVKAGRASVVTLALCLCGPLAAQPLESRDALAQQAELILLAECVSTESDWDPDLGAIVTRAALRTDRYFKGNAGPLLTVHLLGGRVGDRGMGATHGPSLATGERAILFLRRSRYRPYYVVAGGASGKLRVRTRDDGTLDIGGVVVDSLDSFAYWAATRGNPP